MTRQLHARVRTVRQTTACVATQSPLKTVRLSTVRTHGSLNFAAFLTGGVCERLLYSMGLRGVPRLALEDAWCSSGESTE